MNLLEKCLELYKGVLEMKPRTDAMVLQLQQYIVTHFGHEGTRGMNEVDESPLDFRYKTQASNARPLRAFQHPLNANKGRSLEDGGQLIEMFDDPLVKLQAQYHSIGKIIAGGGLEPQTLKQLISRAAFLKTQINALAPASLVQSQEQQPVQRVAGIGEKSEVLAARAAEAGKQNPPSPSPIPAPLDVVEGNTGKDAGTMPEMDVAMLLTLRGKALGEMYAPEVLKFWLERMGVQMTGKESRTQLGNLVLQHIKEKSVG